jgi:cobalt-zinc-cadmium efflux system protein
VAGHKNHTGERRLLLTVILNVIITIAQIAGGFISGSIALISDALHNLSDSLSTVLAWFASRLARKPRTQRSSFGFQRAEILAAFINALVLIVLSGYLAIEAVKRFIHIREVDPAWMFWLGLLGLVANGLSVLILHGGRKENLNLKAAYLHLLGDAFTSFSVILGALFVHAFSWYWVDPLVTLIICGFLLVQTWSILKESVEILMQMAPAELDTSGITEAIRGIEGVQSIHHIHIWKLTDKKIHFEAHVVLTNDLPVSLTHTIRKQIGEKLLSGFGIAHTTLQFEFHRKEITGYDC